MLPPLCKEVKGERGRVNQITAQREVNHEHKHLPPTADRRRSNRQNKAKANREQLIVIEIDTHSGHRDAPAKPSLTNCTAGELTRRMHEP